MRGWLNNLSRAAPLALALVGLATTAQAQLHRATDPVMTPASALVSRDDAIAIDVNPAAVALLPAYSFAYVHSEVDERGSWLGRGDAFYLALPVTDGISLGSSLQSIRPRGVPGGQPRGLDRSSFAFTLAFARGPRAGLAFTSRTFMSGDGRFDGLSVVDLAAIFRPSTVFELGIVGRDLLATRFGRGTGGLDLASTALWTASLRPLGNDAFTLDGALATDFQDRTDARFGAAVLVPSFGRLSGTLEWLHPSSGADETRALVELSMSWGGTTLGGGVMSSPAGDPIGGGYGVLRFEGQARPGLPAAGYIADLQLSSVDPRRILSVASFLQRARRDPAVAGVLLRPRASGLSRAHAQEIRLQLRALRAAGKRAICHLEAASGPELYACAAADTVLVDPAGSAELLGTGATVVLYGETLRKLGVRADFLRIGDYKSAAEQLAQDSASEAAREQMTQLLDDAHARLLSDLGADWKVAPAQVSSLIDEGMHLAPEMVRRGLADGLADAHELTGEEGGRMGGYAVRAGLPERAPRRWGRPGRIGVVMIDGAIVDGENVDVPFFDVHMTGGETVTRTLDAMVADPTISAIVLRVDSPGGAVVASDQIWRAVSRARTRKPVVASMGSVAASGGYYAACAADEIWAEPSTLTGSIGIFAGKVDIEALADRVGLGVEHFTRGRVHGADSIYRPFTPEERGRLAEVLRGYYRTFVERVATGRGMDFASVDALARGRVYTGDRARQVGLVDRLGGFAEALDRARALAGLPRDAGFVVRPARPETLLDYALEGDDDGGGVALRLLDPGNPSPRLPAPLRRIAQLFARGMVGSDGAPLAMLPFDVTFDP